MKNLIVVFCNMLSVALIFLVIELADEVTPVDGILLGFAATIGVIGSIAAAVAVKSIGE